MTVRYVEKKQMGSLNDLFCVFHFLLEWAKGIESHGKGVNSTFISYIPQIGSDLPSTRVTQPRQEKALQELPRVHSYSRRLWAPAYHKLTGTDPPRRNSEFKERDLKATKN